MMQVGRDRQVTLNDALMDWSPEADHPRKATPRHRQGGHGATMEKAGIDPLKPAPFRLRWRRCRASFAAAVAVVFPRG